MRRRLRIIGFALSSTLSLLSLACAPAAAKAFPQTNTVNTPGSPHIVYDEPDQPYAMNYADEAAQTLGFRHGHLDAFSIKPRDDDSSFMPAVTGGVDNGGAMIKLQWHPGE